MTYTVTSGKLHISVEADSPIEAAKKALHECGTVELVSSLYVDYEGHFISYRTEDIISLLGKTII